MGRKRRERDDSDSEAEPQQPRRPRVKSHKFKSLQERIADVSLGDGRSFGAMHAVHVLFRLAFGLGTAYNG